MCRNGARKPARVLAGVRALPQWLLACPSGLWADSQSCLWCHLSAATPPSPKSHSTRSGSFVVGVLINFILINSVISSCLQNLHQALLCDGSAERGCRQTQDSFLCWCYIYLMTGRERGRQRSKKTACLLAFNVISQMPSVYPGMELADCGWRSDTLKAVLQAHGQAWWQGHQSHFCLFFFVEPWLVCLTSPTSAPSARKWR